MSEVIVLVTGGFDPIHSGHILYLKDAKKLGDKLIVGVNSDQWLINKKGSPFMPLDERINIISNLSVVDEAIEFEDDEFNSASNAIHKVLQKYPNHRIIFANGGDRATSEIPETPVCKKYNIKMVDGLGDKIRSSSNLTGLKEIK